MSAEDPIIIFDDDSSGDEDQEIESHQTRGWVVDDSKFASMPSLESSSSRSKNGADNQRPHEDKVDVGLDEIKVLKFMEVTGMSRETAILQLSKFHQDLDLCILAHFDHDAYRNHLKKDDQVNPQQQADKKCISDHSIIDVDSIDDSSDFHYGEMTKTEKESMKFAAKTSSKSMHKVHKETTNSMSMINYKPSKFWNDTIARCKELNVQFVDEEFPPNSTSLDGRRQQPQPGTSNKLASVVVSNTARRNLEGTGNPNSSTRVIKCRCGIPASVKTVQKDGPNYGRFFLACGKPRPKRNPKRKRNADGNKDEEIIVVDDGERTRNNQSDTGTDKSSGLKDQLPPPSDRQCQFFQWDDKHVQNIQSTSTKDKILCQLTWRRFDSQYGGSSLIHSHERFSPNHVRQGAMGDCWFLSALAVVAEKPYIIQRLLPHQEFNEFGCYEVYFCLDGRWKSTLVDSFLPSILRKSKKSSATNIQPAFAAGEFMWPSIIEKAYAKVHGSYSRLSGGFISEAFYDLTGAPVERLRFRKQYDHDELFARLLSFSNAGFLMGIATNAGGDGLVPMHAYSLLGVYEVHDVAVGEQMKVTNFFTSKNEDVILVDSRTNHLKLGETKTKTVRLVRIRNPWGVREWKGQWSSKSSEWTSKIKHAIGDSTCKQGDGTFFMSFEDMIQRFDHMDVAKCQEGWKRTSRGGAIKLHQTGDALLSCSLVYLCEAKQRTWAFISLVQRKKRSNATTQFWYTDLSLIVLKRKEGTDWITHQCYLQGVDRFCDCEIFLEPEYEYCFVPFSFLSGKEELEFGAQAVQKETCAPFQFTTYSANEVIVKAQVRSSLGRQLPLEILHSFLLQMTKKITYAVGPHAVLVTINGNGCIYFLILNSGTNGIALNLKVELSRGTAIVFGEKSNTHYIFSKTQCILMVLANDGRSIPSSIDFSFKTESLGKSNNRQVDNRRYKGIGTQITINLASELLCSSACQTTSYKSEKGTIDERLWNSVH